MKEKGAQHTGASIKDVDDKKGIVTGYFAAFGNVDSDGDITMPGAFAKSILENGPKSARPRIKHQLNHRVDQPLGEIQVLKEDNKGLYYESQTGSHNLGVDFVKMVQSKLITEHSYGYEVIRSRDSDTVTYSAYGKTYPAKELHELKIWEGSSLTGWGANWDTPLTGLKCKERLTERIPLLKSAIRNGSFTDATFEILVAELQAIENMVKSLSETTQPEPEEATTAPDVKDAISIIKSFSFKQLITA